MNKVFNLIGDCFGDPLINAFLFANVRRVFPSDEQSGPPEKTANEHWAETQLIGIVSIAPTLNLGLDRARFEQRSPG